MHLLTNLLLEQSTNIFSDHYDTSSSFCPQYPGRGLTGHCPTCWVRPPSVCQHFTQSAQSLFAGLIGRHCGGYWLNGDATQLWFFLTFIIAYMRAAFMHPLTHKRVETSDKWCSYLLHNVWHQSDLQPLEICSKYTIWLNPIEENCKHF